MDCSETGSVWKIRWRWIFRLSGIPLFPMRSYSLIWRALLSGVIALSWNIATTHCAFTAATKPVTPAGDEQTDECPMHQAKKTAPEPEKKNGCPDAPCCKNLPAAKPIIPAFGSKAAVVVEIVDYISTVPHRLSPYCPVRQLPALDTGPPLPNSFTELVLQRSIPAHGPPCS
jgi:hypothetical protein